TKLSFQLLFFAVSSQSSTNTPLQVDRKSEPSCELQVPVFPAAQHFTNHVTRSPTRSSKSSRILSSSLSLGFRVFNHVFAERLRPRWLYHSFKSSSLVRSRRHMPR